MRRPGAWLLAQDKERLMLFFQPPYPPALPTATRWHWPLRAADVAASAWRSWVDAQRTALALRQADELSERLQRDLGLRD